MPWLRWLSAGLRGCPDAPAKCPMTKCSKFKSLSMKATPMKDSALHKGVVYALLAAALFGPSTPFAKTLVGQVAPLALAGLLYLGHWHKHRHRRTQVRRCE